MAQGVLVGLRVFVDVMCRWMSHLTLRRTQKLLTQRAATSVLESTKQELYI